MQWDAAVAASKNTPGWLKDFEKARRFVEQRCAQNLPLKPFPEAEVETVRITGRRVEQSEWLCRLDIFEKVLGADAVQSIKHLVVDTFDSKGLPIQGILLQGEDADCPPGRATGSDSRGGQEAAPKSGFYKVTNFCEEFNLKKDWLGLQTRRGQINTVE